MKKLSGNLIEFFYKYKYGTLMFAVGIIVAIWDLVTKSITDGKVANFIDGFIRIFFSHNTGAAWSMLSSATWVLIIISLIFIIAILIFNCFFKQKNYFYSFSVGLILSGAICNLFDRIVYGYVRDFIELQFINFPIFNLADCAITIGVILLCIFFIFMYKTEKDSIKSTKNSKRKTNNQNEKQYSTKEINK